VNDIFHSIFNDVFISTCGRPINLEQLKAAV